MAGKRYVLSWRVLTVCALITAAIAVYAIASAAH